MAKLKLRTFQAVVANAKREGLQTFKVEEAEFDTRYAEYLVEYLIKDRKLHIDTVLEFTAKGSE